MGRVAEPLAEPAVQSVLGILETCRDGEAELDEPRSTDRNEKRLVADDPVAEVVKACFDEIATGEGEQIRRHVHRVRAVWTRFHP